MSQSKCPNCNSTNIVTVKEDFEGMNRADEMFEVKDYEYTKCSDCQQDYVTSEQAKRNEKRVAPLAQW